MDIFLKHAATASSEKDEALLAAYHSGDNGGLVILIARYIEVIDKKLAAGRYFNIDKEDVKQEALIALLNAVQTYQDGKGASFATFAGKCLDNSIKNSILKLSSHKLRLLLDALPLEETENQRLTGTVQDNPEEIYIGKEQYELLLNQIHVTLSEFEKNVLFCFMDGACYQDISEKLLASPKSVDNALQRVRRKLKAVL